MDPEIVKITTSRWKEIVQIRKPGGRALIHHSDYGVPQLVHSGIPTSARNRMSLTHFAVYAVDAGPESDSPIAMGWGG